ncbi:MAG: RNA ligase family protein [Candidatus Obscuribacterales bacterium]|nr:RNA ligase family protein [Candidatus Obscuribacterales bacterium]
MEFFKYPSLALLNARKEILGVKRVVATEKLHGTGFRIRFRRGITSLDQVEYGSRDLSLGNGNDPALTKPFYNGLPIQWFKARPELLEALIAKFSRLNFDDATLFGEFCGTLIQCGVLYTKLHEVFFRGFNLMNGADFLAYDQFSEICQETGVPTVPLIWRGAPSREAFDALLDRPSAEAARNCIADGCNISEGVVIQADPLVRTPAGKWLMIKHKSAKFSEYEREGIARERARLGPTRAFAAGVVTRGRLLNVRGHLRDHAVLLANAMPDLRVLKPAVKADVLKECEEDVASLRSEGFLDKEIEEAIDAESHRAYQALLVEEGFLPPPAQT